MHIDLPSLFLGMSFMGSILSFIHSFNFTGSLFLFTAVFIMVSILQN